MLLGMYVEALSDSGSPFWHRLVFREVLVVGFYFRFTIRSELERSQVLGLLSAEASNLPR